MSLRLERRLFIVLAVSCLVLGANGLRLVVKSSAGTGKSTAVQSELVRLTPAPYTTVLEETLSDATGAKRQAWRYTTAVRSDGSHVLWTDFVGRPGANDQRSGRLITLVG